MKSYYILIIPVEQRFKKKHKLATSRQRVALLLFQTSLLIKLGLKGLLIQKIGR